MIQRITIIFSCLTCKTFAHIFEDVYSKFNCYLNDYYFHVRNIVTIIVDNVF